MTELREGRLDGIGSGFYVSDKGEKFRLKAVDRDYNGKRGPTYFLQRMEAGKPVYVSGLFETREAGVYSFDLKDGMGIKHYFQFITTDGGQSAQIKKSKGR